MTIDSDRIDLVARALVQTAAYANDWAELNESVRDVWRERARRLERALDLAGLTVAAAPVREQPGHVALDGEQPLIVDAFGAQAFLTKPAGELGFILDLAGHVNRPPSGGDYAGPPEQRETRYLVSSGQAAELVVELLTAARAGGDASKAALLVALEVLRAARAGGDASKAALLAALEALR